MANKYENIPVLGWSIDDMENFYQAAVGSGGFSTPMEVANYVNDYAQNVYQNYIFRMFNNASLPLNLGGTTEKTKLIQTSNPQGIFDFSLASKGLYKVPEYFSAELAEKFPLKFEGFGTVAGIVPPTKIEKTVTGFYYEDKDGKFPCVVRQKGETEINLGVKGAKLKFATRTKKSYLQYRKNRGKVKYVEIYSIFYYTSLEGDVQYAIRHFPALMAAEYLESIGIKVRFYMTRFVYLFREKASLREFWLQSRSVKLPLFEESPIKTTKDFIYLQPIIAKDFGEDINYPLFFCISARSYKGIYDAISNYVFSNELDVQIDNTGDPDKPQPELREAFERFKNKFRLYNKLGIFKSKELVADASFFFHDMVIKNRLSNWVKNTCFYIHGSPSSGNDERTLFATTNLVSTPFFNWWMRLSATCTKNKVVLINSNQLVKDLKIMEIELNELYNEYLDIIQNLPDPVNGNYEYLGRSLKSFYKTEGIILMQLSDESDKNNPIYGYNMLNPNGEIDIKVYVSNMIDEISTYAEGDCFGTDDETVDKREELKETIFDALNKI